MKSQIQPNRSGSVLFFALAAVLGVGLTIVWYPNTTGSHGTTWDKVFTAVSMWVISSFLMSGFLSFLIFLFLSRTKILDFLRTPYPWLVSLIVLALSVLPPLIEALIYWSEGGVVFLKMFGSCFVPILLISLIAAGFLSPRLTLPVFIKLIIGGAFLCIGAVALFYGSEAIFFEPYVLVYPTRDEWLAYLAFFWFAFLAAWFVWSTGIRLRAILPSGIKQFINAVNTYHPDINFVLISIGAAWNFPFMIVAVEAYYNRIVSTIGVAMQFTSFDKAALRYFVSAIPLTLGLLIFLFLSFATIKLISQPTFAKNLTPSPPFSGLVAVFWLFVLWWIFFASITTHTNFLFPGEFILANNNAQPPAFDDFFFYVFGVLTTTDLGDVKAIGNGARWISVWTTLTGIVLLLLLAEVLGTYFSKRLFGSNEEQNTH